MKFSCNVIAYLIKEKAGFVAWHERIEAWVACAGDVPKSWQKDEPMAKAHIHVPSARNKTLTLCYQPRGKDQKLLLLPLLFPFHYSKKSSP